ncbi:hypothetical protein FN846DRAFT_915266 [Sphaerosporella brunnea]|uniref:Uncharacterized protein n=1 Tax=Sphaerosporella brunnea TaxID=1250544 RepID=A0A5J5EB13_9PEZI|nr:hypothetical protein FN846DRAFT_915266 [Sphaerosporella brunnea]
MGKITSIDEGKVLGFQLKETAEDREKEREVFSRVKLPTGILREVEIVRTGWPQSARLRQRSDAQLEKIRSVILKKACSDFKRILTLKTLRPAKNEGADRKWLL